MTRRPNRRAAIGSGALAIGGTAGCVSALVHVGAPWWVIVVVAVSASVVGVVQLVFPQDSHDRLDWWRDRRRHRERVRTATRR